MASISKMPVEILSLIFEQSYLLALKPDPNDDSTLPPPRSEAEDAWRQIRALNRPDSNDDNTPTLQWEEVEWPGKQIYTLDLFPFSLAFVCRLWQTILARFPHYWTRLVFDLGSHPILPLGAFEWSETLPIDVLIINNTEETVKVENDLTSAVVQALLPHLNRCQSLSFEVIYGSSLPPATTLLRTDCPFLKSLMCRCRFDDGYHQDDNAPFNQLLEFPLLAQISLPCPSFMDLCQQNVNWTQSLPDNEMHLEITNFRFHTAKNPEYTFPNLLNYVAQMPGLQHLQFSRLNLAHQARHTNMPKFDIPADALTFDEVDPTLINDFIKMVNFPGTGTTLQDLTFKRCTLPKFPCSFRAHTLFLEYIEDDFSIYNALDAWQGRMLCFESCPHFDDNLLAWLSIPGSSDEEWNLPHLYGLEVKNCGNFTPGALRNMMEIRKKLAIPRHPEDDWEQGELRPLYELVVCGKVPRLTEEDIVWFQKEKRFILSLFWRIDLPTGEMICPLGPRLKWDSWEF